MWLIFTISTVAAVIMAIIAQFIIAPWQRKKILGKNITPYITEKPSAMENGFASSTTTVSTVSITSDNAPVVKQDEEESDENVNQLFNFLQILAAIFSSFAHGGNDVR